MTTPPSPLLFLSNGLLAPVILIAITQNSIWFYPFICPNFVLCALPADF